VGLAGTIVEINQTRVTLVAELNERSVPIEIDTAWLAPRAGSLRAVSMKVQAKRSAG
jgi:hypothetical protein